jgi:hypothetical protein
MPNDAIAIVASAKALVEQGGGTPAEQRSALTTAAKNADPAFFDMLLARARATNDPLEKLHLYSALAGVEDPALAKRMIDIALSNEVPAGSNINVAFSIALAHPDLAWSDIVPRLDVPEAGIDQRMRWLFAGAVAGLSSDLERIADIREEHSRRRAGTDQGIDRVDQGAPSHCHRRAARTRSLDRRASIMKHIKSPPDDIQCSATMPRCPRHSIHVRFRKFPSWFE